MASTPKLVRPRVQRFGQWTLILVSVQDYPPTQRRSLGCNLYSLSASQTALLLLLQPRALPLSLFLSFCYYPRTNDLYRASVLPSRIFACMPLYFKYFRRCSARAQRSSPLTGLHGRYKHRSPYISQVLLIYSKPQTRPSTSLTVAKSGNTSPRRAHSAVDTF